MAATPKPSSESQATSVFAEELAAFVFQGKLSRREGDVVHALIRGVTRSEDIASALKISAHTVNNHLKSIFSKIGTDSKTGILAGFLRFAADHALREDQATPDVTQTAAVRVTSGVARSSAVS